MKRGDWDREMDRAVDWLWEKTCEAIDLTFPRGMLWGSAATGLKAPATMNVFKTILRIKIVDQFLASKGGSGVDWDCGEPLKGEMLRNVGVDGRFPSPPFLDALRAIGADDVIPYLKPGMHVTINPGAIVVHADFCSKGERIEVPKSERNGDDQGDQTADVGVVRFDETGGR
jgi:hypothetical protein